MNKKSTFVKWRRYLPLYLMLIPGAVYIFINNYIPMAGLIMAFEKYDYKLGMFKSPKIGLDNFTYLFATKDALNITRNTLLYNAVFIILGNILDEEKTISDADSDPLSDLHSHRQLYCIWLFKYTERIH